MSRLVVVQILRAPIGGIRKHVVDILESLENQNVDQVFITNFEKADRDLSHLYQVANLKTYNLNIAENAGFRDLLNIVAIVRLLRNRKVDVIHGHGAKGGLYARILGLFLGGRVYYTPHGGSLHRIFGKIQSLTYDLIERLLVPLTYKYIFESEYSSRSFLAYVWDVSGRMVVNHNGVDLPSFFKHDIYQPRSLMKFASFGLLRELKGHDIFIEALARVRLRGVSFEYVIYGSGSFYKALISLVEELNLSDHVTIRPFAIDVYAEMVKYDFVVQPSRFESFGYVPIEAMAVGVPVISSLSGGLKEVVNAEVALVAPTNAAEEYMDIIEDCYYGRCDLSNLRNNGRKWIGERFTKRRMIDKLVATYYCV